MCNKNLIKNTILFSFKNNSKKAQAEKLFNCNKKRTRKMHKSCEVVFLIPIQNEKKEGKIAKSFSFLLPRW
jgi:hypothetical protein